MKEIVILNYILDDSTHYQAVIDEEYAEKYLAFLRFAGFHAWLDTGTARYHVPCKNELYTELKHLRTESSNGSEIKTLT